MIDSQIPLRLTKTEWEARGYGPVTDKTDTTRHFLVGMHHTGRLSPVGRGTRGYIALEIVPGDKPQICFMKDYWRPIGDRLHTELETYERLRSHRVGGVATAIAGGDAVDAAGVFEATRNQEGLVINNESPRQRRHFRLVTREIGRSLDTFLTFPEFIAHMLTILYGASPRCVLAEVNAHYQVLSSQLIKMHGRKQVFCTAMLAGKI